MMRPQRHRRVLPFGQAVMTKMEQHAVADSGSLIPVHLEALDRRELCQHLTDTSQTEHYPEHPVLGSTFRVIRGAGRAPNP
jgi:hypothetical protein